MLSSPFEINHSWDSQLGPGYEGLPRSGGKGGIVQSVAFGGGKISMSFIVSFPNPPVRIRPEKLCLGKLSFTF